MGHVRQRVLPGSLVYTDVWRSYNALTSRGYHPSRVNHPAKVYVEGDVHTNTIEGFWAHLKGGLRGVYHGVSTEHLQSYLGEYVFRYNAREATGRGVFARCFPRSRTFVGRLLPSHASKHSEDFATLRDRNVETRVRSLLARLAFRVRGCRRPSSAS